MGDLYCQLAADYHRFFPARQTQLDFLTAMAGAPPARVLDAGSGTGEYVAALNQKGYDAFGVEVDEAMHAQALARHPELLDDAIRAPRLILGDMLAIDKLAGGHFDLAYCIGNTLSHLESEAQAASVIDALWKLTRPEGTVVLQLVNYEHILAHGHRVAIAGNQRVAERDSEPSFVFDLPLLSATRDDGSRLEFDRQFLMRRAADLEQTDSPPEKLIFHATLRSGNHSAESYIPQLLLTAGRLGFCLPRTADRHWYGNFEKADWHADAPATIVVLR